MITIQNYTAKWSIISFKFHIQNNSKANSMPNPDVKTTNKLRASEKNMSHTALIKITLNYWKR